MNVAAVLSASNNDFVSLVGIREAQSFEAKQEWPELSEAAARWEFAKDVAAMANGGGGIIVFGLATEHLAAEDADQTCSVHLVDRVTVNESQALGILKEYVSPALKNVTIQFVSSSKTASAGLVIIEVPPQASKVLLCKVMDGQTQLKEFLFGFAERDRDSTRNWRREDVSEMLRTGTSSVSAKLDNLEQMIGRLAQQSQSAGSPGVSALDRLDQRVSEMIGDTARPAYVLYFAPLDKAVIRDFFNAHGELIGLIVTPPETRSGSFGMRIRGETRLHEADYWEIANTSQFLEREQKLRVYVDGTVMFYSSADSSFLCWPKDANGNVVNPVVVADSAVSFARFCRQLVLAMSVRSSQIKVGVEIRNAASSVPPLMMYSGPLRQNLQRGYATAMDLLGVGEPSPRRSASTTSSQILETSQDCDTFGADRLAFQLVTQFYNIFGFSDEVIPYVAGGGEARRIDVAKFP